MPRFHFDLREDGVFVKDDDGLELADEKAAEQQAIDTATSVARDAFGRGSADRVLIEVWNTHREPLMKVAVTLKVERVD
jgi:uncharacterized protein DUF6894